MKKIGIMSCMLFAIAISAQAQNKPATSVKKEVYQATATKTNDLVHTELDASFDLNNACSDTDVKYWDTMDALYLTKLPVELQKHNSQTLHISLNITLEQLINNEEKTVIVKRKIDDDFINFILVFP